MKKYITVLIFTILCLSDYGQSKCNCEGLIDIEYKGQVCIYDKPNGKIVDSIANDLLNEDFLVLTIMDIKNGFFSVSIKRPIANLEKSGWINSESYIGTYARNYSVNITLNLYSLPTKDSKIESSVKKWIEKLYRITDCKGNWLKVKISHENMTYSGWLEKEMQCANPYTYCN